MQVESGTVEARPSTWDEGLLLSMSGLQSSLEGKRNRICELREAIHGESIAGGSAPCDEKRAAQGFVPRAREILCECHKIADEIGLIIDSIKSGGAAGEN